MIAELKCLEKNPTEADDWKQRIANAFKSTGHTFDELMAYVEGRAVLPVDVGAKLVRWVSESLRGVVKTANRQVRQSKLTLNRSDAWGALLVANDRNYGFAPTQMVSILSDAAARLNDNHLDVIVYFTPNVFHHKPGSDVAWIVWEPRYGDDATDELVEFVNDLGRSWNDYTQVVTGDHFVERYEAPDVDHSELRPVRRLGRE